MSFGSFIGSFYDFDSYTKKLPPRQIELMQVLRKKPIDINLLYGINPWELPENIPENVFIDGINNNPKLRFDIYSALIRFRNRVKTPTAPQDLEIRLKSDPTLNYLYAQINGMNTYATAGKKRRTKRRRSTKKKTHYKKRRHTNRRR